ncbi:hypothetical protein PHLGIDRAFT_127989 [Phlebiopsis gigantea 11061_1 CR5-6]|uniref:Uncharacterized protein n=1 Tax=Phlebiopsis gigantea (strain 11061_1 CR5-6) TaxID=745531 RepID=A0A0C3PKL9_PHLG1|nr:hypothetical protein PHLGIDRAFT_127989 [Phlebiopsis gigantea 11061_1 CR5-6]
MSKALSNGTMSLKFMQNAQRAKQQAQVELEQAKIRDEAEWEVSQETKDAWGIGVSSFASTSSVVHESSYMPFLFTSAASGAADDAQAKPKGRRSFNTKGKEVEITTAQVDAEIPLPDDAQDGKPSSQRLTSISGFKVPSSAKSGTKTAKAASVQQLIRDDIGKRPPSSLRTDNGPSVPSPQRSVNAAPAGFLKPSGIDAPSAFSVKHSSKSRAQDAQDGAPPIKKRDRDDSGDKDGKKRRKNKDKSSVVRTID